jgi:hypothetical protein
LPATTQIGRLGPLPAGPNYEALVRLIRRICLLRESGDGTGAARLEAAELSIALESARAAAAPGGLPPDVPECIFAAERERVADAILLSGLIVAQLHEHFPATGASHLLPASAATGAPSPVALPTGPVRSDPPAIPDLLDAMLAHDRTAARRRASTPAGAGTFDQQTTHPK